VTASVAEPRRAIANFKWRTRGAINIPGPRGVLCAGVRVDVQLLAVPLQGAEPLILADQVQGAVGMDRSVGHATGSVTADPAATETMQTEDNVLVGEGPPGIGADAAAVFGGVIGSGNAGTRNTVAGRRRSCCSSFFAGVNAVAEAAE